MQKLSDKKSTIGQIKEISKEKQIKIFESIVKANTEQFTKIANILVEGGSFTKSIQSITASFQLPIVDMVENFRLPEIPIPQIPDSYSPIDTSAISFERYDPPVVIKKSKWEIEKEAREAYRTELQIQILEQQLNLYKGMLAPQYDINTGIITFMGKNIEIPLNTNMEIVCRVVLKNMANMKRKWSWEQIIEAYREDSDNYKPRQIYSAVRSINDKVAIETQVKDFLLAKPYTTVQLDPKFMPK